MTTTPGTPVTAARIATDLESQRQILRDIINAYDSRLVRSYCTARFVIININMLHILQLCMRSRKRVLEIGCGFGLFGLYFAARNPDLEYHGFDLNAGRIAMARRAAEKLGLRNVRFEVGDACKDLPLGDSYDSILMMDLLHHLPDTGKRHLIGSVVPRLAPGGHLIIKEIMRRPAWKLWFTWLLDVLMTRGFDMWYWRADQFREIVDPSLSMEAYPISDWLPYPHVVYLFSRDESTQ
ncbi:MAG: class I SAM-dependent methyltransferase [Gemmatimonadales bacterium]